MAAETMNEEEARAALNAANAKLAGQAHWPWSRHAAYAAVVSGMVASQGFPSPLSTVLIGMCSCFIALIVSTDRAKRGVWISGWRGRSTRWVTVLSLCISIGALLTSLWLNVDRHMAWLSFVLAAAVFAPILLLSKLWETIYRRELEQSA
jgi:hypothetical protein